MKITTLANNTTELLDRASLQLAECLHAMRDAMSGQPAAHAFDTISSQRSVLWCWTHEREVHDCEREDLDCDGETIATNDPTGEAAVSFDQARLDRSELEKLWQRIHRDVDHLVNIQAKYQNRELSIERSGIGRCADCGRYADGKKLRLILHRGRDLICDMCRKRRDRLDVA